MSYDNPNRLALATGGPVVPRVARVARGQDHARPDDWHAVTIEILATYGEIGVRAGHAFMLREHARPRGPRAYCMARFRALDPALIRQGFPGNTRG